MLAHHMERRRMAGRYDQTPPMWRPSSQSGTSSDAPFLIGSIIICRLCRIHNTYMVASAWKIVLDSLRALEKFGLSDATAHIQLQKDQGLLSRYLVVCDLVSNLVDLGQKKFSVLATTTRTAKSCQVCTLHALTMRQPIMLVTSRRLRTPIQVNPR
jgi:hypothetical protein